MDPSVRDIAGIRWVIRDLYLFLFIQNSKLAFGSVLRSYPPTISGVEVKGPEVGGLEPPTKSVVANK